MKILKNRATLIPFTFILPISIHKLVKEGAAMMGITIAEFIRNALRLFQCSISDKLEFSEMIAEYYERALSGSDEDGVQVWNRVLIEETDYDALSGKKGIERPKRFSMAVGIRMAILRYVDWCKKATGEWHNAPIEQPKYRAIEMYIRLRQEPISTFTNRIPHICTNTLFPQNPSFFDNFSSPS